MDTVFEAAGSVKNGKAKREELERQLLVERNTAMLEHALLIGVLRYDAFYRTLKSLGVCSSVGAIGSHRPDFSGPGFNQVYAIISRYRDGLTTPLIPGDHAIGPETLNLILIKEAELEKISVDDLNAISRIAEKPGEDDGWLVRDLKTLELDRNFIFGLPLTLVFQEWRMKAVVRQELDELRFKTASGTGHISFDDINTSFRRMRQASQSPNQIFTMPTIQEIEADDGKPAEAIIENILRIGGLGLITGRAKKHKSWAALDLFLSVATGRPWFDFKVKRGLAVYCDFELGRKTLSFRVKQIAEGRGIKLSNLDGWLLPVVCQTRKLLRTFSSSSPLAFVEMVLNRLADQLEQAFTNAPPEALTSPRLIILDSLYKIHAGTLDENNAAHMTAFYDLIRDFAERLNAAVILVHHFSKGDVSGKQAGDRAAGSRVHRQDPEAYIELVPLTTDNSYRFEAEVRGYPATEPFSLRFQFPILMLAPDLDPDAIKGAGRHKTVSAEQILLVLGDRHLARKDWLEACHQAGIEISPRTFDRRKDELEDAGKVLCDREGEWAKSDRQAASHVANGDVATGKSTLPNQNGNANPSNVNEGPGKST